MRTPSPIPLLALVAALALGACSDEAVPASQAQGGNEDVRGQNMAPAKGVGTAVNDTAPYRPGIPPQQP